MKINRRDFIRSSSIFLGATALGVGHEAQATDASLPIMQGTTDHESTTIVILHAAGTKIAVRAKGAIVTLTDATRVINRTLSTYRITGLAPGLTYVLEVITDNGLVIDRREFGALNTANRQCRIAFVSCMNQFYPTLMWSKSQAWHNLAARAPDMVFITGDALYLDPLLKVNFPNPTLLAYLHIQAREQAELFRLKRLIPLITVWDDHDFGADNQDRTYVAANESQHLYEKFFAVENTSVRRRSFGVGSVLEVFGQRFFFMDDRRFRDPQTQARARYWGDEQTEWLFSSLAASKAPTWLINGNQFFGGYLGKESFEGNYNADFKTTMARLTKIDAPVAFVSGDVHFSEMMEIEPNQFGYTTYELTSSRMYSFPAAPKTEKLMGNTRRLANCMTKDYNFMIADVDVSRGWNIDATCVSSVNGANLFTSSLSIDRSSTTTLKQARNRG